jgi:asparagine synthase (glutamine-hydrolysing)
MCGILAAAKLAPESDRAFEAALLLQRHRGPDGQRVLRLGESMLGFARLSIIDLSECSMQPIRHQHITLVMNGEIYNYLELRTRLASEGAEFTSHGDAEALAAAIAHWGPERAFREARGMWACVAHDARTGSLYASRDRVGIKPLWWANTRDGLVFSSEIKSLLALDPAMREIDVETASAFVAHGVLDEHDRSFYRHIRSFTAGHWAEIRPQDHSIQSRPFWELNLEASAKPQSIDELRSCLRTCPWASRSVAGSTAPSSVMTPCRRAISLATVFNTRSRRQKIPSSTKPSAGGASNTPTYPAPKLKERPTSTSCCV